MKVSQSELFGVVAIILYTVFFSHSPPAIISSALGNVYISVGLLALLTYVTLYKSRTIGVLLIIALLLTMTHGVEHLSNLSVYSAAPSTPLVNGRCPIPGTAIGRNGKFCRGPCPAGTILSGNNCMRLPVSPVAAPTSSIPTVAPALVPIPTPIISTGVRPDMPGAVTPNISTPIGSPVINTPILSPNSSTQDNSLQNIVSSVTSNPESSAHLAAAVKADPVAFAPLITGKISLNPSNSTSLPSLSNPTAPASSSRESEGSLPEPSESCNIETFAPF